MPEVLRPFPIIRGQYDSPYHRGDPLYRTLEQQGVPASVPWSFVAPHEAQAKSNHDQTLVRLAQRGGLSPGELLAVVTGQCWSAIQDDTVAIEPLLKLIAKHTRTDKGDTDGD